MRHALIIALCATPALAACQSTPPAPPTASGTQMSGAEASTAPPSSTEIPSAITGRWGLTANDCDPKHEALGDNKGLMTVGPTTITFYESRATLRRVTESSPTRISAQFDMAGEGQTWQRDMVLDVQDGGKTLIRREYGSGAQPGPLRYTACPTR